MAEIFVSYARKDKEKVQEIMRDISSSGYEYWMDSQKIQGGELWTQQISEAIEACRVLLFFMSADSILSDNVRREVQLAFEKNRKIVILRLDRSETPLHLQYALAGIQWIDHGDSDWRSRLSIALTRTPVLPKPQNVVRKPETTRSSHDHDIEQVRRFEGAMPATSNLNLQTEVRVMISLSTSRGLRAHLPQTAQVPGEMTRRDVKRSDVPLNFPRDTTTNEPLDLDLWIVISAQGFDIEQPAKKVRVPAKSDSGVFSFALTPRVASQHAIVTLDLRERKNGPTLGTLTLTTEVRTSQAEVIQQFWNLTALLMTSAVVASGGPVATQPVKAYSPAAQTVQSSPNQVPAPAAKPATAPAPRRARGTIGSIAFVALCACVAISTVLTFQVTQSWLRPVATPSHFVPTEIHNVAPPTTTTIASPTVTPTTEVLPTTEVPPTTDIPPTTVVPSITPSIEENLLAYYPLNGTREDATGNYSQINIGTGTFSGDEIYCDGVAYSCVQTPPITELNYQNFSISADFQVDEYPQSAMPVFVGGRLYRWVGFNLSSNGNVALLYNNTRTSECQGSYSLNTWHTALITYDGSVARLYLDEQLICSETFVIEAGGGNEDKDISSSNFSNASAFKGYLRNLKIYGTVITP